MGLLRGSGLTLRIVEGVEEIGNQRKDLLVPPLSATFNYETIAAFTNTVIF